MSSEKRLFLVRKEEVDHFDVVKGWSKVPSPFAGGEEDVEEAIRIAGFESFTKLGSDEELSIEVYNHCVDDRFLVGIWGPFSGRSILVNGLPSLVELMSKLGGIAGAGALTSISERLADLEALMTGEDGPLEAAVAARNLQRRRAREKRQSEKESR
jgi:hypothetical protein